MECQTNLLKLGKLFKATAAEVDRASRLFRVPALLGLDLNRVSVSEGVGGQVGRQEDAIVADDDPMAHDVLLAALDRPELLSLEPDVLKVRVRDDAATTRTDVTVEMHSFSDPTKSNTKS